MDMVGFSLKVLGMILESFRLGLCEQGTLVLYFVYVVIHWPVSLLGEVISIHSEENL